MENAHSASSELVARFSPIRSDRSVLLTSRLFNLDSNDDMIYKAFQLNSNIHLSGATRRWKNLFEKKAKSLHGSRHKSSGLSVVIQVATMF